MRKGDLVFVQGKGIISKVIRWFDKGEWSHCAIAVNNHAVIEADYDIKSSLRGFDKSEYNKIEVIDLGLTLRQRHDIFIESMELLNRGYDHTQLLWYVLKKVFKFKGRNPFNNPNKLICSELVFIVLDKAGILDELGIRDTFTNGNDLTPNELYDLVKFVSKK